MAYSLNTTPRAILSTVVLSKGARGARYPAAAIRANRLFIALTCAR
jgi:hypothetical protein